MVAVRTMFLITAQVVPTARHDLALLDAARRAGVRRVVKPSAIGTGQKIGSDVVGAWHMTAEQAVRDSGLGWTVLRPSSFASNTLQWVDAIDKGQPLPDLTGPGQQGVINPYDVAAVAVEILLSSAHVGKIYTLTRPELLTVAEQVACLSRVTGRRIGTLSWGGPRPASRPGPTSTAAPSARHDPVQLRRAVGWADRGATVVPWDCT
jgi:uncharacterized protein YbjT (DUF2867 family)